MKKAKDYNPKICFVCGNEYNPDLELCIKYHEGNICFDCSREMYEDEIGYEDN